MFVVVEMPKYKPPNPLWQSEYDGESINMIFACLVSEEFILNGGKEVIGVYDTCWWYSLCNFQYRPHDEQTGSDSL